MEKPDALCLSVRLDSGKFETTLRIPFPTTMESGQAVIEQWLKFVISGLELGINEATASWENRSVK